GDDDHLGDLGAGDVEHGPEGAVGVAADGVVVPGGLDVVIGPEAHGHVGEVRAAAGVDGPAGRKHDQFDDLGAADVVLGVEAAVGVAADDTVAGGPLDVAEGPVFDGHVG